MNWDGDFFNELKTLSERKWHRFDDDGEIEERDYYLCGGEKVIQILQTSPELLKIIECLNTISCRFKISDIGKGVIGVVGPYGLLFQITYNSKYFKNIKVKCQLYKPKKIYITINPSKFSTDFKPSSIHPWSIVFDPISKQVINEWNKSFPVSFVTRPRFSGCSINIKYVTKYSPDYEIYKLATSIIHETMHFYLWYLSKKPYIDRTTYNSKCQVYDPPPSTKTLQQMLKEYISDEVETRKLEVKCSTEIWSSLPATYKSSLTDIELRHIEGILKKSSDYIQPQKVQLSRDHSRFPVTYVERFVLIQAKLILSFFIRSNNILEVENILHKSLSDAFTYKYGFVPTLPDEILDINQSWNTVHEYLKDLYLDEVEKWLEDHLVKLEKEQINYLCAIVFTEILMSQRWDRLEQTASEELDTQTRLKFAVKQLRGFFGTESRFQLSRKIHYFLN